MRFWNAFNEVNNNFKIFKTLLWAWLITAEHSFIFYIISSENEHLALIKGEGLNIDYRSFSIDSTSINWQF